MKNQKDNSVEVVNFFKSWFDEKVNTITGAANSGAESISFTADGEEFANIKGRDKDMFLLGLKASIHCIGKFPISMTAADGISLIETSDSQRLEFLIQNRLRIEKWNIAPETEKYYVYNDEDDLVADAFTSREAIDLAIQKYEEATNDQC